jgi:hypothetical protein
VIVAELVTLAAILLTAVLSIRKVEKTFAARLKAQDEAEAGRQVALYKQQKATARAVAQSDKAVRRLADETRSLQGESAQALRKVDRFVSDQKTGA